MKISLFALIAVAATLCSCGSSRSSPPAPAAVAVVDDQRISRSEYQQYVLYAANFYAAAGQGRCAQDRPSCAALRRQVLRRLLEEQVVVQYAQHHHIGLSPAQERQVSEQVALLAIPDTPAGRLLAKHKVTRDFVRSLLRNELLVQRVEQAVIPPGLDRGQSYRLRIVTVPIGAGGEKAAYQAALDLATNGGAAPPGATDRTEWMAAFRLARSARHILEHAQIGEYVGPYRRPAGFRDFQLLGEKWGRFGRPARLRLETIFFRHWINSRLRAAHPACYASGKRTPCPGENA